jgi:hypothetical protein
LRFAYKAIRFLPYHSQQKKIWVLIAHFCPFVFSEKMSEELKILKRSYLTIAKGPLKDSMLSAKRWCVLVKDLTTGSTRMDFFRDEKASTKGEQCRNSLNVASVVEAQRVTEKKQTFELLCPGVSHRFQANSEAEADDWVSDIKSLIVYRKDTSPPARSFSLPTPNLHQPYNPHANLPTPPDTNGYLTSPPIPVNLHKRPTYLRSSSTDSPQHPFPSPNSSGDSSSLNSASTGSMEIHSRFMLASEGGETSECVCLLWDLSVYTAGLCFV